MVPRRMYWYAFGTVATAAVLTVAVARSSPVPNWPPVLALVALTLVMENFAFELPLAGSVSFSFPISYAALLHSGPFAAVLCGVAASISIEEHRAHKPLVLRIFNAGQLAIAAGVAGLVYMGSGGHLVSSGMPVSGMELLAALAAAVTFFVLNVVLVGYAACILTGRPMSAVMREQGFLPYGASMTVLAMLGLIIAHLLDLGSWVGLALLVLPFALARRTFRVYLELSEAYTATVRSLVTAIEAKDPYTRGHSERVALLSRALAERTGLPDGDVEIVERAALLHDVGKIGVSVATLTSASPLTADEVREIRNHPVIGSELLEKVDFLSSIVPIVRHHHEHVDGAGYPDGLRDDEIPPYARLLAAVDAFDAMTSDRAYRPAMSDTEAMAEMVRVAGQQLDPSMVNALSALLLERQRSEVQQA